MCTLLAIAVFLQDNFLKLFFESKSIINIQNYAIKNIDHCVRFGENNKLISIQSQAIYKKPPFCLCVRLSYLLFLFLTVTKSRKRRQFVDVMYPVIEPDFLCSGGKAEVFPHEVASCVIFGGKLWQVKCKIYASTCYQIQVCPDFDYCYMNHLRNNMYCCEWICI